MSVHALQFECSQIILSIGDPLSINNQPEMAYGQLPAAAPHGLLTLGIYTFWVYPQLMQWKVEKTVCA